ncbi:hypothetical protein GCM10023215_45880 [Pseudonocardia yuanmonensis]|uniref:Uncharacterized protein n=1 Tax=Pseudonocardia yuanmonensis TaxID=1095914 RepID=A0ABP8X9L6_9PSEU
MLVALVDVAAARVPLPDLDELVADRSPLTAHLSGHDHALADGLATALDGEVDLERVDVPATEARRSQLDALGIDLHRVLRGWRSRLLR